MNYKKLMELMSKPWIDVEGIMEIAQCGKHSATKIRVDIEQEIISSGKKLPISSRKSVPTQMVLDYLGLDPNYIYIMAKILCNGE